MLQAIRGLRRNTVIVTIPNQRWRLRAEMVDQHELLTCPLKGERCLGERCAWWNHLDDECSVKTLGTLAAIDIGGRQR